MWENREVILSDFNLKLLGPNGALARYRGSAPLNWYCALILNHTIVDYTRTRNRFYEKHIRLDETIHLNSPHDDKNASEDMQKTLEHLEHCINELKPHEQSVLRLYYYKRNTLEQLAAVMGISKTSVFRILRSIECTLRAKLASYKEEGQ